METIVKVALVAAAAFLSTSTDNLVLLTVLLGQRGQRPRPVLLGYALAAAGIAAAGLLIARLSDAVPQNWLGYLGVIPLGMGLVRLRRALRPEREHGATPPERHGIGTAGVALLMLANSSDTVAVTAPLFAETDEPYTYVIAATLVATSIGWFGLALAIGGRAWMRTAVARLERWLVPALLIAIGLYILADTASDTL